MAFIGENRIGIKYKNYGTNHSLEEFMVKGYALDRVEQTLLQTDIPVTRP